MPHSTSANGGQQAADAERDCWRSPLVEMAVNIAEEQIHDLDPQRRRARHRTQEALERSRPKDKSYRRRNSYGEPFEGRPVRMLESPAYRVLSLSGHRVISRVEIELARHAGHDNGQLVVSYQQFVDYGIERHAIAPAIRECVALGFLAVTEQGRAGNREHRSPSKYRLTYRHAGRAKATHEWERIRSIGDAELIARAARGSPAKPRRSRTFSSAGKPTNFGAGNPHRNPSFSVRENPPTPGAGNPHYYLDSRVEIAGSGLSRPSPCGTHVSAVVHHEGVMEAVGIGDHQAASGTTN
jgi:hypothetical protein